MLVDTTPVKENWTIIQPNPRVIFQTALKIIAISFPIEQFLIEFVSSEPEKNHLRNYKSGKSKAFKNPFSFRNRLPPNGFPFP